MDLKVYYTNIPFHYIIPMISITLFFICFSFLIRKSAIWNNSVKYKNLCMAKNNPQKTEIAKFIKTIKNENGKLYGCFMLKNEKEKIYIDKKLKNNFVLEPEKKVNVNIYENNFYIKETADDEIIENLKKETKNGLILSINSIFEILCLFTVIVLTILTFLYIL